MSRLTHLELLEKEEVWGKHIFRIFSLTPDLALDYYLVYVCISIG